MQNYQRFQFRKVIGPMLTVVAALAVGCPMSPPAADSSAASFDGEWLFTNLGRGTTACLTISGETVTAWDDGCLGLDIPLSVSQPAAIVGDTVVWTFSLGQTVNDTLRVTLNLTQQSDGGLRGSVSARSFQTGFVQTDEAILVRR